jgi:hypothetical protein
VVAVFVRLGQNFLRVERQALPARLNVIDDVHAATWITLRENDRRAVSYADIPCGENAAIAIPRNDRNVAFVAQLIDQAPVAYPRLVTPELLIDEIFIHPIRDRAVNFGLRDYGFTVFAVGILENVFAGLVAQKPIFRVERAQIHLVKMVCPRGVLLNSANPRFCIRIGRSISHASGDCIAYSV